MALNFAYYLIQFIRLVLSAFIVFFGFLVLPDFAHNIHKDLGQESSILLIIVGFGIVALIACNKLIDTIKAFQQKSYFTTKNKKTFAFCTFTLTTYILVKYSLLLYIISIEKGKLAISDWWQDEATQLSELISLGLLACFFWIIAKLIEEGIVYKNEHDLTI